MKKSNTPTIARIRDGGNDQMILTVPAKSGLEIGEMVSIDRVKIVRENMEESE